MWHDKEEYGEDLYSPYLTCVRSAYNTILPIASWVFSATCYSLIVVFVIKIFKSRGMIRSLYLTCEYSAYNAIILPSSWGSKEFFCCFYAQNILTQRNKEALEGAHIVDTQHANVSLAKCKLFFNACTF